MVEGCWSAGPKAASYADFASTKTGPQGNADTLKRKRQRDPHLTTTHSFCLPRLLYRSRLFTFSSAILSSNGQAATSRRPRWHAAGHVIGHLVTNAALVHEGQKMVEGTKMVKENMLLTWSLMLNLPSISAEHQKGVDE